MKRFLKTLSFIILIIFNFSLINVFAITKEYLAYSKYTSEGTAFFVNDDGEKTVYCYNHDYKPPGSPNEDSINKTYYTREESYLNTDDELMDKYGKEIKERIAALLVYGYPLNSSNLMEQYGLNEDKARYITQQLVWDITNGNDAPFGDKYGMYGYYDKLLELSKIKKFEQGNLNLIGNFKFIQRNGIYLTDKLSTTGNSGSFTITNLPENMTVKDWNTDQILNDKPIKVGQEFYIESSAKPDSSLKLKISYNYQEVKFYFYKYSRGGLNTNPDLPYQSLIRAELEDKFTEKPYEISIDGNFVPSQDIGKVVLNKKDSQNGKLLKGAVFNLQDQQGNNIRTNLITDENGQIVLNDLAPGDYQFVETKAPNGYELDTTPVKFTIVVGQTETVNIEKVNTASLGGVVLTKKDSKNGNLLEGAVFNLQDQQGNNIRTNLITDENGQIVLNDLAPGDYQFVETKAPNGYELDATPVKFTIVVGQTETVNIEKVNTASLGGVVLTKKDSKNGNLLEGAVFNLQDQQGNDIRTNLISDENGQIILNDLAPGDYQFVETKAPEGYELDATPVKFTIVVAQKEAVKVEKTNILAATNLKISKIDSNTKNPLNGSEFEIYSQNDTSNPLKFITTGSSDQYEVNIIGESTLMANGVDSSFTINKLGYGDYILKEIKAPSGYKLGKDIYIHLDKINSYYKIGSDGEKIDLNKDESLNLYNINVENEKGIVLPETGGNGFITQRNIAIMVLGISFILMINFLINKKRRIN
ncbi:cell wall anchor protein [Clostridium perfringens]|uniref:SpaA isopeptide-forming pilin-related protein n=2 Tax=Clostridium perfringens TaxID=1502 RepID=UPI000D719F3C|nr:SpaA isopeptide-forming pilin-related protein [Clostridium perfringens]MDM0935961.1 SpaA isopeptide-forming pilin-related protein [Clostridium perfringens]PWW97768.1 cell wall anchor protein [Clostridium perfringens]PWX69075.1 cell wall anchor protein [Clostridium perfringens]HAT4321901.1 Cys-Gln thioester bond-forming surface protein [Clostridium perfringens]HAT4331436.1 Cys-Gln thioester bond-forming surface protein [Clostridium perfringens]